MSFRLLSKRMLRCIVIFFTRIPITHTCTLYIIAFFNTFLALKMPLFADTGECSGVNVTCEYACENSSGSFVCICNSGFELSANGINCTGSVHFYSQYILDNWRSNTTWKIKLNDSFPIKMLTNANLGFVLRIAPIRLVHTTVRVWLGTPWTKT